MAQVVCCSNIELRYRKRNGGCKVLNDSSIQVSEIDAYLNEIMRKPNFTEFISVKITNIHTRPLRSMNSDDSDETDVEEDAVYTDVEEDGVDTESYQVEIVGQ